MNMPNTHKLFCWAVKLLEWQVGLPKSSCALLAWWPLACRTAAIIGSLVVPHRNGRQLQGAGAVYNRLARFGGKDRGRICLDRTQVPGCQR